MESFPSGSASVVNELVRIENEKDATLLPAEDVAETFGEGSPFLSAYQCLREDLGFYISREPCLEGLLLHLHELIEQKVT